MTSRTPPHPDRIRQWHREYPVEWAECREFRHLEAPFTVNRPYGPHGIIEVTRICQRCKRLVTRVYSATFTRIPDSTRVSYDRAYLVLPGSGGVDRQLMAERAIRAEEAQLGAQTKPARRAKAAKPEPEPVVEPEPTPEPPAAKKTTARKRTPRKPSTT